MPPHGPTTAIGDHAYPNYLNKAPDKGTGSVINNACSTIEQACSQINTLTDRVRIIADQIMGSRATEQTKSGLNGGDTLQHHFDRLGALIAELESEVSRFF